MIPGITCLILNYNPDGEKIAQDIMSSPPKSIVAHPPTGKTLCIKTEWKRRRVVERVKLL
jgi:hypothetical protein